MAATAQVGDQGLTLGRDVALLAGLPHTVPGFAVDRMCAGALTAVTAAAGEIAMGACDVAIAGGVEHMGHHPMGEGVDPNPRILTEKLIPADLLGLLSKLKKKNSFWRLVLNSLGIVIGPPIATPLVFRRISTTEQKIFSNHFSRLPASSGDPARPKSRASTFARKRSTSSARNIRFLFCLPTSPPTCRQPPSTSFQCCWSSGYRFEACAHMPKQRCDARPAGRSG
jgi:hypothetical protein